MIVFQYLDIWYLIPTRTETSNSWSGSEVSRDHQVSRAHVSRDPARIMALSCAGVISGSVASSRIAAHLGCMRAKSLTLLPSLSECTSHQIDCWSIHIRKRLSSMHQSKCLAMDSF